MIFISAKTPKFIKRLFPNYTWEINTNKKELYLTFDDGPTPKITPWVLKTLIEFEAKATFFCIGNNIEKHPDIFQQVISEGHTIGNHTYNHKNGWKLNSEEYIYETKKCEAAINKYQSGIVSDKRLNHLKIFRPPYGRITNAQGRELISLNYKIIMWDVVAYDWSRSVSPINCLDKVIKNATNGSIVVLHDSLKAEKNMKFALPRILEHFSENGYEFKAIT